MPTLENILIHMLGRDMHSPDALVNESSDPFIQVDPLFIVRKDKPNKVGE